jgi:hypothetical protein
VLERPIMRRVAARHPRVAVPVGSVDGPLAEDGVAGAVRAAGPSAQPAHLPG